MEVIIKTQTSPSEMYITIAIVSLIIGILIWCGRLCVLWALSTRDALLVAYKDLVRRIDDALDDEKDVQLREKDSRAK